MDPNEPLHIATSRPRPPPSLLPSICATVSPLSPNNPSTTCHAGHGCLAHLCINFIEYSSSFVPPPIPPRHCVAQQRTGTYTRQCQQTWPPRLRRLRMRERTATTSTRTRTSLDVLPSTIRVRLLHSTTTAKAPILHLSTPPHNLCLDRPPFEQSTTSPPETSRQRSTLPPAFPHISVIIGDNARRVISSRLFRQMSALTWLG